jgi:hypothetical protein
VEWIAQNEGSVGQWLQIRITLTMSSWIRIPNCIEVKSWIWIRTRNKKMKSWRLDPDPH